MEQGRSEDLYDIAIIGGGPTGLFASFYAGLRGMKTLLVDALPELGGQLAVLYPEKYIYDVPGFPKILARDLVRQMVEQAMQYEPDVRLEEPVVNIEPSGEKELTLTTSARQYRTKAILIAAGVGAFAPNKLNVPGVERLEGRGIFYFVKRKSDFAGKRLVIVGGGDSAVDWCLNLLDTAAEITLVHRRDQFRAHEGSVRELHESPVRRLTPYEVREVHGDEQVEGLTLFHNQTGEELELSADAVLMTLGYKADIGPIKNWGLQVEKRSIKVDERLATQMPGVYAAGDIAASEVKLDLIAVCFGQAAIAVNAIKTYIDPKARLFPGHSSDMGDSLKKKAGS